MSLIHAVRRPLAAGLSVLGGSLALLLTQISAPAVSDAQSTPAGVGLASHCGVLTVDNPSPGDRLIEGGYVVTGLAYDPSSSAGAGISRVDFFLGSRDEGGVFLGDAIPGGGIDPRAYRTTLSVPKVLRVSSDTAFFAYAYADNSTGVTTVSVPVFVGPVPTPTPNTFGAPAEPLRVSVTSNCQVPPLTPQAQAQAALATPTPAAPVSAPAGQTSSAAGVVFQIANPNPGDLLQVGRYQISGLAYDPASTSGSGIDRIQFFLDPRDDGGLLLGEAASDASGRTFSGEYVVPAGVKQRGPHTFTAYARSAASGRETVVSIPLYFGLLPTATPRP